MYNVFIVISTGNTLLHVFGGWLFEAAVWTGQDSEGFPSRSKVHSSTTVISSAADLTRLQEAPSVSPMSQRVKEYEAGRAEVFVALCTIFSSQECGESVIPTYLARFYHSLSIGLQYDPHVSKLECLSISAFTYSPLVHYHNPFVIFPIAWTCPYINRFVARKAIRRKVHLNATTTTLS